MDSKYIIYQMPGFEAAIIFDATHNHKDVAETFLKDLQIISAGFCRMDIYKDEGDINVETSTYGEAISIRSQSRPEDKWIINKMITREP